MTQPSNKRGRPSKGKASAFRIMTWFNAVSQASGLTAFQLDVKYAAKHQLSRTRDGMKRPCIWDKYRRGTVGPSIKPRKGKFESIVQRVERDYPGTARWLTLPLWQLLEAEHLAMEDLRDIFRGLDAQVRDLLLCNKVPTGGIFWEKPLYDPEPLVEALFHMRSLDATTALIGLIRQAEITQNQWLHQEANWAVITILEELECEPPLKNISALLRLHLIHRFSNTNYSLDGTSWRKPFVNPKHLGMYRAILAERRGNRQMGLFDDAAA